MTREELIKRLSYRDQFDKPIVDNIGLGVLLDEAIAMLKDDRPKGRWIYADPKDAYMCISMCTACNNKHPMRTHYCPWCGAYMREETEDE